MCMLTTNATLRFAIACNRAIVVGCTLYAEDRRVRRSNSKLAIVLVLLAALPVLKQPYQPRKKGAAAAALSSAGSCIEKTRQLDATRALAHLCCALLLSCTTPYQ